MNNYIKRLLEDDITKNSKFFPAILVCGSRQLGKNYYFRKTFK